VEQKPNSAMYSLLGPTTHIRVPTL